ncbi:MAG: hypothetical protein IJN90_07710 [Bacilli bacterium]|nr:hypothetical protein [Bacilli bacterium]
MNFLNCSGYSNLIFNSIYYIGYYCFIIFLIFLFFSCVKKLRKKIKNKTKYVLAIIGLLGFCIFIYIFIMYIFNFLFVLFGDAGNMADFIRSCEYETYKADFLLGYIFGMFNIYILTRTLILLKVTENKKKKVGMYFLIFYFLGAVFLYPILDYIAPKFDIYEAT